MSTQARVCLFSQRHLLRQFYRCANYELEDTICAVDDVAMVAPVPTAGREKYIKWRRRLAHRVPGVPYHPGFDRVQITGDYDLFLTVCEFIDDLDAFDVVRGWRDHSRITACYLTELWAQAIPKYRRLVRRLAEFDYIFVNCAATAEPLAEAIGRPCHFLLPGIDALRFSPGGTPPARVIDVYSLGRRDPDVHSQLLGLRRNTGMFYLHDTYESQPNHDWSVKDFREHRRATADLIQRSRFFVVNPAKVDFAHETAGQLEIGYRFFEGAAGGSVMIGRPVDNELFRANFNWPDAVISIPEHDRGVAELLEELDGQPERIDRCRREGMRNMLLRHDWAYRWEAMLGHMGLEPDHRLDEYKTRLAQRADLIGKSAMHGDTTSQLKQNTVMRLV